MDIQLFVSKNEFQLTELKEHITKSYQNFPDDHNFWCMIDLVSSSNYRLLRGSEAGYVRGEIFFAMIFNVMGQNDSVLILKEMGDAVLCCSRSFRPLFESVILINQVAEKISSSLQKDDIYPFKIRSGIGYGEGKKLAGRAGRYREDYLSAAIDQLARLMAERSEKSNFLIQDNAFRNAQNIIDEYKSFVSVSDMRPMESSKTKGMITPIHYVEIYTDSKAMNAYDRQFVSWNKTKK